jgi:N utilization substance protein B
MQALYALKQSRIANYHNAVESMDEVFAPDLLAAEKQDLVALEGKKNRAIACLEDFFNKRPDSCSQETPEIQKAVNEAIVDYRNQVDRDKKHFSKILSAEMDGIFENYIKVLAFPLELAEYTLTENEEEKTKLSRSSAFPIRELRFRENPILAQIARNKEFISNTSGTNKVWDKDVIRSIFRNKLKGDKVFGEYLSKAEKTFEDHRNILLHIIKEIIFKDEALESDFEEKDLKWFENRSIVKSMAVKTIKSAEEGKEDIKLLSISANWEDDKEFFEELYKKTVERDEEFDQLISEKVENWDIERLAALDRIILVLAISEMVHFPSIPVKVSINEYIELSKLYSTPKSKQFVNGILDKLAEDLTKSGLIKKSGRGLIDNK